MTPPQEPHPQEPPQEPHTPKTIATLILTSENPRQVSKTLLNIRWSTPLVNATLKLLWDHAPKALEFFLLLDRHRFYSHSLSSLHLALDLSSRLRRYSTSLSLLRSLHRRRLRPTPLTFSILLDRYVAAGKLDKAFHFFFSFDTHFPTSFTHDLKLLNSFLDLLCKSRRVHKAVHLMGFFKGRGVRFDVVTYNIVANGWCLVRRVDMCLGVLKGMVDKGIDPNLSTFNVVLKGYFRAGRLDDAWAFFKEVRRRGWGVDVVTYTTLIHGFGVAGEVGRARRLFDGMVGDGVLPNVATYNALIQVLCRKDSVENAIGVFGEMVRKGYVPNVVTYNGLIRGLCHVGEMGRAEEFVGVMRRDGCEPNVQTFNLLIRYYCEAGEIEKGLEVFGRMTGTEECLPNLDTYNVLISKMFVRRKSEDLVVAGRLLVEMVDRGFRPTRFNFNRVLNGLLLTGNQEFAREILRLQSKCGLLPRQFRL
ncbi:hypothetical protein vseg_013884 [Gypsophila vaccaria]